jgi:hypothetical protein
MTFLKNHKTAVALVAVFALVGSAAHFSGMTCSGNGCLISSLFSTTTAYAGPGCSSNKACDAEKSSNVKAASATATENKTCSKEECVKVIMAEKNLSRDEAEKVYTAMVASGACHTGSASVQTASASGCASKASAQTASASGCAASCASKASATTASASGCSSEKTTASFANATEGKSCGDKEACIAKCMAEKGLTRAEAEACYEKCQAAKATQANVITGSDYTREAWIDAKVASGLTRAEAEVAAAKAEAAGEVKFITASASGCATATKASASGSGCCASKASANTAKVEETKPATAVTVSTGGTK